MANFSEHYRQAREQRRKARALLRARNRLAGLALAEGEVTFARAVRAGCWDSRADLQAFLKEELDK